MGNHLVGIAPSQIYPVENYLMGSFESDLQYESRYDIKNFFLFFAETNQNVNFLRFFYIL